MKKILTLASLMLALNGYSQSYMILGNGVTLTTDKTAFVYDFNHFILPYKVTLTGGQFLAEDGKFISIDDNGFLYRKDEKAPSKLKGKGNNYVIADNGVLYTFDSSGFLYKFDKDSATKKANHFGGNFFTSKPDDKKPAVELYTLNSKGNYFKTDVVGLNPADIRTMGGTYFQTSKGVIYTITKDGFVFAKLEIKVGQVKKIGGNFFVDDSNAIYTVSDEGFLFLPALPSNLKVATITKIGQNYFLDQEGKLFVIDSAGAIFERDIKTHDLKDAKILSI
jgi:hypothetical protein